MKKIITALCLGLALSATCFATEVTTMQFKTDKTNYKYPRFTLESSKATQKINKFVNSEFKSLRKIHNQDHELVGGGMDYKVILDDEKYLCFTLEPYDFHGGAHGMYYTGYYVFDKETGNRMKYYDFVPSINSDELRWGIKNGYLPVELEDGSQGEAPFMDENTLVKENFRLNGDGSVSLVYGPYELDCYAAGNNYVKLTTKQVEKLKVMMPSK
ncbi:MAG: DUF4163 domain-containing protein [Phascolarctobacterium sp.]|nr:DUF4163 domain-containing protein [Phascolarctobacterium sp.]